MLFLAFSILGLAVLQEGLFLGIMLNKEGDKDFSYVLPENEWKILKSNMEGTIPSKNKAGEFVGRIMRMLYACSSKKIID